MSNAKQETIADIAKEMRGITFGEECCPDCGADFQRSNRWIEFADRFEAAHRREVAELLECLGQAYGDKIGTYTMKGNEVERWRKALREKGGEK